MATYSPKASEIERSWHLVDAEGMVLGRLATEVATLLRGKHKPTFAPHIDTGDHVVIVNADKVVLTAGKSDKKMVYRHSGYPGGLRSETYGSKMARRARSGPARHRPGHAAQDEARPGPDPQAQGLRRAHPSPRRPEAPALCHRARPGPMRRPTADAASRQR